MYPNNRASNNPCIEVEQKRRDDLSFECILAGCSPLSANGTTRLGILNWCVSSWREKRLSSTNVHSKWHHHSRGPFQFPRRQRGVRPLANLRLRGSIGASRVSHPAGSFRFTLPSFSFFLYLLCSFIPRLFFPLSLGPWNGPAFDEAHSSYGTDGTHTHVGLIPCSFSSRILAHFILRFNPLAQRSDLLPFMFQTETFRESLKRLATRRLYTQLESRLLFEARCI